MAGLSLQRSGDASCEVQRAVIYLSGGRDCYRGAGSLVPAVVPARRVAHLVDAFDGEVGKTSARCLA